MRLTAEEQAYLEQHCQSPAELQKAAERLAWDRLTPTVQRMSLLAQRAASETLKAIASYRSGALSGDHLRFSEPHRDVLQASCLAMVSQLLDATEADMAAIRELVPANRKNAAVLQERPVIDLAPGGGKTELAKSLMVEVSKAIGQDGFWELDEVPGILFLADQIDQLETVYLDLERRGLKHGRDFGMYHGSARRKLARIGEAEAQKMPILLATVQQLQALTKRERKRQFFMAGERTADLLLWLTAGGRGRQRSLVIKDECLLLSSTYYFDLADLEVARATVQSSSKLRALPEERDATAEFMARALEAVNAAASSLKRPGQVEIAEMPQMDDRLGEMVELVADRLEGDQTAHEVLMALAAVGSLVDLEVALHRRKGDRKSGSSERTVFCKSISTWPLDRVPRFVTLDANYRCDLLTRSNRRFERSSVLDLAGVDVSQLKRMHPLRLHLAEGKASREFLASERNRDKQIAAIVKTIKPLVANTSRRSLVFTFKARRRNDYGAELNAALVKAGIDPGVICMDDGPVEPHHRVVIARWGSHISTNRFVSCSAVFFLGVIRLQPQQLLAGSWGEQGDLRAAFEDLPWNLTELDRSQIVCHVTQAILRTMARMMLDGMCPESDAYLWLADPGGDQMLLIRELRKLLGDFTLLPWTEVRQTKREQLSDLPERICSAVLSVADRQRAQGLPVKVKVVDVRKIAPGMSPPTWRKYREQASVLLKERGLVPNGEGQAFKAWVESAAA